MISWALTLAAGSGDGDGDRLQLRLAASARPPGPGAPRAPTLGGKNHQMPQQDGDLA